MRMDVLMSINPKWVKKIFTGIKTKEIRKRAPAQKEPYTVYVYCTKGGGELWVPGILGKSEPWLVNGTVCGEFTCAGKAAWRRGYPPFISGSCLTPKEMYAYLGANEKLDVMMIENTIMYNEPKTLEEFGFDRAPQSWNYVRRTTWEQKI